MLTTEIKLAESRLTGTSMPDHNWWESLWPQPQQILRTMGLKRGMSVLDLGCGYGHFTIPAAQIANPALVIGVDIDTPILAEAKKAAAGNWNCLWLNHDLLALSNIMVSKFDYVMMHSTFHGLPNSIEFVQAVIKLLNPGGHFSVINWQPVPREETIWLGKPRGPKTEMRLSMEHLLAIVKTAAPNLSIVHQCVLPPYHYGVTFRLN
jgi:SAM-dependent methyltransferase